MVKHIILWQLIDELSAEEKKVIKAEMKEAWTGAGTFGSESADRRACVFECGSDAGYNIN